MHSPSRRLYWQLGDRNALPLAAATISCNEPKRPGTQTLVEQPENKSAASGENCLPESVAPLLGLESEELWPLRGPTFCDKLPRLKPLSRDNVMWKAMASIMVVLGTTSAAGAQTITDPSAIASRLHFWTQETGDPVYYGEVRNVNPRNMQILGHYRCLAIAFIKYEGGVFYYAHKMWAKSSDGSCHYDDVTSRKVDNHGFCVKDSDAGFGTAIGTARMTKDNVDYMHSVFRTIDTNTRFVGETGACIPPKGVGAGLYSIKIENGRLKIMSTRPLDYEVNMDAQDPHHPPTNPVF